MRRLSVRDGMVWAVLALGMLAVAAGCQQKILRENVLATTQSMVGLSVAQSPQTQMYELRAGYSRNEFFLVPTSKRVVNDASNRDAAGHKGKLKQYQPWIEHNDPSLTPEVLGEIQVGGQGKQGTERGQNASVSVYQRLAVGREAVKSPAATVLLSQDAGMVSAAGGVLSQTAHQRLAPAFTVLDNLYNWLAKDESAEAMRHRDVLDGMARRFVLPRGCSTFTEYSPGPVGKLNAEQRSFDPSGGFESLIGHLAQLNRSIGALQEVQDADGEVPVGNGEETTLTLEDVIARLTLQRQILAQATADLNGRREMQEAIRFIFFPSSDGEPHHAR